MMRPNEGRKPEPATSRRSWRPLMVVVLGFAALVLALRALPLLLGAARAAVSALVRQLSALAAHPALGIAVLLMILALGGLLAWGRQRRR